MKHWLLVSFFLSLLFSQAASGQWEKASYPITAGALNSVYDDHGTLYACFIGSSTEQLFRSTDQALTWTADTTGIDSSGVSCVINMNGLLFAAGSGVYRSDDNGLSWNRNLQVVPVVALAVSGDTIFAFGVGDSDDNSVLYRSTNEGVDWDTINRGLNDIYQLGYSNGTVFAWDGHLFRSIGGTTPWVEDTLSTSRSYPPMALTTDGNHAYVLNTFGVFVSSNGGNSWLSSQELPGDTGSFDWLTGENGMLLAGSLSTVELSVSTDNATTWSPITRDGFSDSVETILYAVKSGGYIVALVSGEYDEIDFWRLPLADLSVAAPKSEATNVSLYPNPASDVLNIPANMNATSIELFDPLGRSALTQMGSGNWMTNVSRIADGTYEAVIHSSSGTTMVPVVIRH